MKILVFGGDSAAHVFAWKLVQSPAVDELICAPGNGGTSFFAPSVELGYHAVDVASFVVAEGLDLVIADDGAIAAGATDEIAALPLPVIGSGQAMWNIVRGRCATREWLQQHDLPLSRGRACTSASQAETVAASLNLPVRIATDAASGPVEVCSERAAIAPAVASCLASGNEGIVVEELVTGPLVTASFLGDGESSLALPTTRLWRRASHLDTGFDAVHSGTGALWHRLEAHLEARIRQPLFAALRAGGSGARGWLGATCVLGPRGALVQGLQLVPHGLEVAAVLSRLDGDLLPLVLACARGTLALADAPRWSATTALGVGLIDTSPGAGVHRLASDSFSVFDPGVLVFHHHTAASRANTYVPEVSRGAGRRISFGSAPTWPSWIGRGLAAGLAAPSLAVHPNDALLGIVVATGDNRSATRQRLYDNLRRLNRPDLAYRDDVGAGEL